MTNTLPRAGEAQICPADVESPDLGQSKRNPVSHTGYGKDKDFIKPVAAQLEALYYDVLAEV